jgi:hypothetical protein
MRKVVTSAQIREIDRLRAGKNGRALTVAEACKVVGISKSIYYRYKQHETRFPALVRDWDAYSDEAGHAFQLDAGHLFRFHSGRHSDLKPATFWV